MKTILDRIYNEVCTDSLSEYPCVIRVKTLIRNYCHGLEIGKRYLIQQHYYDKDEYVRGRLVAFDELNDTLIFLLDDKYKPAEVTYSGMKFDDITSIGPIKE